MSRKKQCLLVTSLLFCTGLPNAGNAAVSSKGNLAMTILFKRSRNARLNLLLSASILIAVIAVFASPSAAQVSTRQCDSHAIAALQDAINFLEANKTAIKTNFTFSHRGPQHRRVRDRFDDMIHDARFDCGARVLCRTNQDSRIALHWSGILGSKIRICYEKMVTTPDYDFCDLVNTVAHEIGHGIGIPRKRFGGHGRDRDDRVYRFGNFIEDMCRAQLPGSMANASLILSSQAGHDYGWAQTPGLAFDITDGWVIGTAARPGGFSIHRWRGSGWERVDGGAIRIGGSAATPWVVNDLDEIYRWSSSGWQRMPGTAKDVADRWIIGTTPRSGGFTIHRWNGSGWQLIPGGAIRIGGTFEKPWISNDAGEIYRWNGSGWTNVPGRATDIADGWIIGTDTFPGGRGIYRWNGAGWDRKVGGAVQVGGTGGTPWVVNNRNEIFRLR
jgi:hypothetical protein